MQYLSYQNIETIAEAIVHDFLGDQINSFNPINVERLAKEYLGLALEYMRLSDDGSILGLTTYNGITFEIERNNSKEKITIPRDTIIIEEDLLNDKQNGRKNFTLSHECAHQVLFRVEPTSYYNNYRKQFTIGKTYSLRALTTKDDWCEWQANALGAAILMPQKLIDQCLFRFGCNHRIILYGNHYLRRQDRTCVNNIALFLGVSFSALIIRLRQLKMIEDLPFSEYHELWEVTM
jgi:Zn-dependent peptidase ImmA (M78 family)